MQRSIVCLVALLLLSPSVASAQRSRSRPAAPPPAGPTLDETKHWIENDMPVLTKSFTVKQSDHDFEAWTVTKLTNVSLNNCKLSYDDVWDSMYWSHHVQSDSTRMYSTVSIPLKDLALNTIAVAPLEPSSGWTVTEGTKVSEVRIPEPESAAPTIVITRPTGTATVTATSFRVSDAESGERIVRAVRRAAELCGAAASTF